MPCAIGHILEASAKDLAASLSIAQLLVNGCCLLEADSVVLVVVGTRDSDRDGLSLNPGVEQNELVRVAFNGARVGGDLSGVLVMDDAQFEGCPERMRAASAAMVTVCVSIFLCLVLSVCGFWMVVASGAHINRQIFLLRV